MTRGALSVQDSQCADTNTQKGCKRIQADGLVRLQNLAPVLNLRYQDHRISSFLCHWHQHQDGLQTTSQGKRLKVRPHQVIGAYHYYTPQGGVFTRWDSATQCSEEMKSLGSLAFLGTVFFTVDEFGRFLLFIDVAFLCF